MEIKQIINIVVDEAHNILYEDTIKAGSEEDFSIKIWAINSDFVIDKDSHYHAVIKVIEEG